MTRRKPVPVAGQCKDCDPGSRRPVFRPGPRCATHLRDFKRTQADARHDAHLKATYGISRIEYEEILRLQGGRCAICRRVIGVSRNGHVDHDHSKTGRESVRGILDQTCNFKVLGHLRDDPEALRRGADYLEDPPAQKVLRGLREP